MFGSENQRARIGGDASGVHRLTTAMNASTPRSRSFACSRARCATTAAHRALDPLVRQLEAQYEPDARTLMVLVQQKEDLLARIRRDIETLGIARDVARAAIDEVFGEIDETAELRIASDQCAKVIALHDLVPVEMRPFRTLAPAALATEPVFGPTRRLFRNLRLLSPEPCPHTGGGTT